MKRIPLTRGLFALVDDEDFERLARYNWHAVGPTSSGKYYAQRCAYQTKVAGRWLKRMRSMHHDVMRVRRSVLLDHCDRDSLNNQKHNLRRATLRQNAINATTTNAFGRGVSKCGKHFYAAVTKEGGKRVHLGAFHTAEEARRAHDYAARRLYGEFAVLNSPEAGVAPVPIPTASRNHRPSAGGRASGYRGVHRIRTTWFAQIQVKGRMHYLGSHPTAEDGARAYNKAARRLHGEFAWLNRDENNNPL